MVDEAPYFALNVMRVMADRLRKRTGSATRAACLLALLAVGGWVSASPSFARKTMLIVTAVGGLDLAMLGP